MLPTVMTARSTLVAALAATLIATVPAPPALAWGDKEQGFVAGVATAVIIDQLLRLNLRPREARNAPVMNFVEPAAPATMSIYRTPAARAFQSYSPTERKAIQRNLRASGHYRGGIDGAFGPGTYNAVIAYARDEGLSTRLSDTNTAFGVYDSLLY